MATWLVTKDLSGVAPVQKLWASAGAAMVVALAGSRGACIFQDADIDTGPAHRPESYMSTNVLPREIIARNAQISSILENLTPVTGVLQSYRENDPRGATYSTRWAVWVAAPYGQPEILSIVAHGPQRPEYPTTCLRVYFERYPIEAVTHQLWFDVATERWLGPSKEPLGMFLLTLLQERLKPMLDERNFVIIP